MPTGTHFKMVNPRGGSPKGAVSYEPPMGSSEEEPAPTPPEGTEPGTSLGVAFGGMAASTTYTVLGMEV